jgi:hypothetical protein
MSRQDRSSRDASRAVTPKRPKTEGSPAQQDQDMGVEGYSDLESCGNVSVTGWALAG